MAPLALRSSGDDSEGSAATPNAGAGTLTCWGEKKTSQIEAMSLSSGWRSCAAFESSPEERSNAGAFERNRALCWLCFAPAL